MNAEILIVGAGPAGALTAAGLKQLGYEPLVIDAGRSHDVMEGVAARVVKALQYTGFRHSLAAISTPLPRRVLWGAEERDANTEAITYRPAFNRALRRDLEAMGITVEDGHLRDFEEDSDGWRCTLSGQQSKQLKCAYLVDARGRSAAYRSPDDWRSPEHLSVYQHWHVAGGSAQTLVASTPDGWLWLVDNGQGECFTQFIMSASEGQVLREIGREQLLYRELTRLDPARYVAAQYSGLSGGARGSTAMGTVAPVGRRYLRVGDSALAPDPLSGNGLFLAVSAALIAPSVINTQLHRPADAELAATFYTHRLHHQLAKFQEAGSAFYHGETRWPERTFWGEQQRDYPPPPAEPGRQPDHFTVQERAVVNHGWIERRQLPVNADYPLGVWNRGD